MRLSDLDIDSRIIEILAKKGISELYPPQEAAMKVVLEGHSVVMAVPTASGKTLVAYIAALRTALDGGKAIYIVPLRALASEKFDELKEFETLGIKVEKTVGDFDAPEPELKKADIIVATSERADSLLRHRSDWMHEIKVVVADEIHLINDADRGPTMEVILVKLRRLNPSVQIIGLSATIKNSGELAEWLGARHIQSEWRPVDLREGVLLGSTLHFVDNTTREIEELDDSLNSIVLDIIVGKGQILIFVNTRRSSESLAERLSKRLFKILTEKEKEACEAVAERLDAAEEEPTSIGARLKLCIQRGAAFHNAGLTDSQRKLIEDNFRKGEIKCIVATPTLAAGINLPARCVVVRDLHRYDVKYGHVPIPVLEVKQMCGRAGRPQYDKYGEAVLLADSKRGMERVRDEYLLAETEAIMSKMGSEPALRTHILSAIATGYAEDREDLMKFIGQTFFAQQMDLWTIDSIVDNVIEFLKSNGLISTDNDEYKATIFGRRTSDLYIDPLSSVMIKEALARSSEVETNALSALHACCSTPDMPQLYLRAKDPDWLEAVVADNKENFLLTPGEPDTEEYQYFLSALKTACMLEHWMDEIPENDIVKKFNIGPGDIRARVENGEWLLYSMREIARLHGSSIAGLLNPLVLRIRYGIKEELLPLVSLKGIGRKRARILFGAGYKTHAEIKKANFKALEELPGIGKGLARSIKEQVG